MTNDELMQLARRVHERLDPYVGATAASLPLSLGATEENVVAALGLIAVAVTACETYPIVYLRKGDLDQVPHVKPDAFAAHEVLDRAYLAYAFFAENVTKHPRVQANADLKTAAEKVEYALVDFYQLVGQKTEGA